MDDADIDAEKQTLCFGLYDTRKLVTHALITAVPLLVLWVLYVVDVVAEATMGDTLVSHQYCVKPRSVNKHIKCIRKKQKDKQTFSKARSLRPSTSSLHVHLHSNMESHSMLGMLVAPFSTRPEEW